MSVEMDRSCGLRFGLFVFLLLLAGRLAVARVNSEAGAFYTQQYSPEVYGANPQNWAVVQNNEGILFFGNSEGVLEYDGASWRKVALKNIPIARSLAADGRGTIYVGGQNDFGYLRPDSTGTLQYASLVDSLGAGDRHFGDVRTVNVTPNGVLFSSEQRIFRWSAAHGMKVWKPASRFGRLYVVDGVPYVVSEGTGLLRIDEDALVPLPGGEAFAHELTLRGIFRYAGSLVFAKPNGLYRLDGKKLVRFVTQADKLLPATGISACSVLKDGELLLGTSGGLIMLNASGGLERIVDRSVGLRSNSINAIYTDRDGETWLALNRGLAYIATQLPLTQFGERQGLDEAVTAVQRQNGTLYAGTIAGLMRMAETETGVPHFVPVKDVQGIISRLLSTRRSLLVAGGRGIYSVTDRGSELIFDEDEGYDVSSSIRDPDLIYVTGPRGIYLIRFDGKHWRKVFAEPSEGQIFRSVLEDSDGRVWVTTRSGVLRFDFSVRPAKVEHFTKAEGVPSGLVLANRFGNRILFGSPRGILRFDSKTRRFVPFEAFGKIFVDGSHGVQQIAKGPTGEIWIASLRYHGVLRPGENGSYIWVENPLILAGIEGVYAFSIDPDNVVWASGTDGGLARYHATDSGSTSADYKVEIRNVKLLRADQTLFGGDLGRVASPEIRYQQNSVRFQYAAPRYQAEPRIKYQVLLEGLDRQWSPWASETSKEYTNLGNGHYIFRVHARDLSGHISGEDSFGFRVLAPWYRSWWAYLLYLGAGAGFISLIVMWRVFALAQRNHRLETIIHQRTDEIRSQRDEIKMEEEKTEALLLNILPAPVADELRATGLVTPMAYDNVTVCFTDFVAFTLSSEKVSAADLVAGLHKYFTAFDQIVDRYGLEKMKTIGDSYMFVGGLPQSRPSHAVDAVMAALEIVEVVKDLSQSSPHWDIRVGVHSGPVIAGVVGVRKFAFDIWGETVNFASRFESSGRANRVNISARTYGLVKDFIACESRGPIPIKEGRLLDMYFARHVRRELLEGDSDNIPSAFSDFYEQRFGSRPAAIPALRPALSEVPERAGSWF